MLDLFDIAFLNWSGATVVVVTRIQWSHQKPGRNETRPNTHKWNHNLRVRSPNLISIERSDFQSADVKGWDRWEESLSASTHAGWAFIPTSKPHFLTVQAGTPCQFVITSQYYSESKLSGKLQKKKTQMRNTLNVWMYVAPIVARTIAAKANRNRSARRCLARRKLVTVLLLVNVVLPLFSCQRYLLCDWWTEGKSR